MWARNRWIVPLSRFSAHDAAYRAVFGDEIQRKILDEEVHLVLDALAVERVQDGMSGAVGRGAGTLRDPLAVMRGHAAEGALVDLAFLGAAEGNAEMLELIDRFGRAAAEIFDGILVAEPVRPFDGVVHVPAPVVLAHVAKGSRDTALAATVWLRVGKTLVMQAVLRPLAAHSSVARKPAPPAPTTTTSNVWSVRE